MAFTMSGTRIYLLAGHRTAGTARTQHSSQKHSSQKHRSEHSAAVHTNYSTAQLHIQASRTHGMLRVRTCTWPHRTQVLYRQRRPALTSLTAWHQGLQALSRSFPSVQTYTSLRPSPQRPQYIEKDTLTSECIHSNEQFAALARLPQDATKGLP